MLCATFCCLILQKQFMVHLIEYKNTITIMNILTRVQTALHQTLGVIKVTGGIMDVSALQ